MKRIFIFAVLFFTIFIFADSYSQDRIIVKTNSENLSKILKQYNGMIIKKVLDYNVIKIGENRASPIENIVAKLKNDLTIEYADYDYIKKISYIPNDPGYDTYQWNMNRIGIENYTEITTGSSSVVIAIADTGIDLDHEDLQTKLVQGHNFVAFNSFYNPYNPDNPDDDHGHGTHCAGIAAAITNNSIGVAGVAPLCKLMPIKVMNDKGEGYDSDIAEGIIWAADHGANVISISLGGNQSASVTENACNYAYNNGCVVVAATGNDDSSTICYPSRYENVIAVGASDYGDNRASYSNYGEGIDLVAPGGDPDDNSTDWWNDWIISTYPDDQYKLAVGTSMACPHVAGAAAMVIAIGIQSPAAVKEMLMGTAFDIGDSGYDEETGWGRLDLFNALNVSTMDLSKGFKKAYCFPNPFKDYVNVIFKPSLKGKIEFKVYNEYMELLFEDEKQVNIGNNVVFSWSAPDYNNGVYFFLLKGPGGKKIVKGVKVK
jgi:thermitase